MDEPQRQRLKSAIEARISTLKAQVREKAGDSGREEAGRDNAPEEAEVGSAILHSARQELKLLRDNLSWLEDEEGGYCEECGCEIKTARLLVVPTTRLCVACAARKEITG